MAAQATQAVDLRLVPAATPPPGVVSNLVDPPTLRPHLVATVSLSFLLTVPLVAIKLFTKIKVFHKLDYEDWVLLVAQILAMAWIATFITKPSHGEHMWDVSVASLEEWLLYSNILEFLYNPAILLAKWAIVLQIQRIFCAGSRTAFWWSIRATIWANVAADVTLTLLGVFQCVPRARIWDAAVPGRCIDVDAYLTASGIYALLMNVWILLLPLPVLRRLQMTQRKKLLVAAVFGVNALSAVCSAARLAYSVLALRDGDATYNVYIVGLWAAAELAFTLVAASFPAIPLFLKCCRGTANTRASVPEPDSASKRNHRAHGPWSVDRGPDGWSRLHDRAAAAAVVEMQAPARLTSLAGQPPQPPPLPGKEVRYEEYET